MDALQAISGSGGAETDYVATIDKLLAAADESALKDAVLFRATIRTDQSFQQLPQQLRGSIDSGERLLTRPL